MSPQDEQFGHPPEQPSAPSQTPPQAPSQTTNRDEATPPFPTPRMNAEPSAVPAVAQPRAEIAALRGDLSSGVRALAAELSQDLQIELDGDRADQVARAMSEIDMAKSESILFFGSKAQASLSEASETMLEGVRTKDVGPAGDALNSMVQKLRTLDVSGLDPREKQGFFGRLFGIKTEIQKYLDKYSGVKDQIETIATDLEKHKTQLLTDVTKLDKLYDANLEYFRTLEVYIAAGRAKLKQLDEDVIPAMAAEVEGGDDVIEAQKLRDLRSARDDLERRVHDLLLTRQVTMQSLPSIRLVQENDESLINKINSTLVNTVPLWRNQLAQAVAIYNSSQAAKATSAASDLTNELLTANAENLKTANAEIRREVERGVFDIETVKQANETLIATIQESLQIADEGKKKRAEAEEQLQNCETELRKALAAASARAAGAPAEQTQSR